MINEDYSFRKLNGNEVFKVLRLLKTLKIRAYVEEQLEIASKKGIVDKKQVIDYIMKDLIFYIIDNYDLAEATLKDLIMSYIDKPNDDFGLLDIDEIMLSLQSMFKMGLGETIKKFFGPGFLANKNV